ncbi:MAG: hypothetical protein DRN04_02930 [Thermoprotei archaeon]|nr:MAG: hypothetical protein DRN04_02930 [Thermoprotei archaeon]
MGSFESRVMMILNVLFSLSAVNKDKAVSLTSLSKFTGLLKDELKQLLEELSSLGYVITENERVYLTRRAIFKLSSVFC